MKENKIMLIDNKNEISQTNGVEKNDSQSLQDNKEFNENLSVLKSKVNELREFDKKALDIRLEVKDLANNFVNKFKGNKVELGKVAS
jgi:hypothetical protein